MKPLALVVEDDPTTRRSLAELVSQEGFETLQAETVAAARAVLQGANNNPRPDVVLCDLRLPDGLGTELLTDLEHHPDVEFVMITGQASVDSVIQALRGGATDYLKKPVDISRLTALLHSLRRTLGLKSEVERLRQELRQFGRFGELVGRSPAIQRVYDLIQRVAPSPASVFLIGESGTGKELAARTLHQLSRRSQGPFLPLNCGAIAPSLMESELFGHEKGSFTGATRRHQGYFERASGGTLFLDEITEMPAELQVKLLRVLETDELLRVGGVQPVKVNARVIAATNRDPEAAVEEGRLRKDLYFRLNVFPIPLPRLAVRDGDARQLALFFLDEFNCQEQTAKIFADETLEALGGHTWPGNVRELRNVVYRAYLLADSTLQPEHLPPEVLGEGHSLGSTFGLRVGCSIAEAEERLIHATLEQVSGNKTRAADVLGISLKTLYNRLNDYRLRDQAPSEAG